MWDFKEQIILGTRGEEIFVERYPTKLHIHSKHAYDFDCEKTGSKIELKSDTYNIDKTDNFFIERYSDINKKRPGGVWQSYEKGVTIFCYFFVRNNIWFQFNDLPKLITRLEKLTKNKGLIFIKNKGWTTGGYKVNREDLADMYDIWSFEE